jgi:Arm DNA-binding domain
MCPQIRSVDGCRLLTIRLTDTAIRKANPADKPVNLADGAGLYLEPHPRGSRYRRMKYRHGGSEQRLALGVYPEVTLAESQQPV